MKDKLKPFFIHLLASVVIAGVLSAIVFLIWYPNPLPKATGITQIFLMMLVIDVIIGPILTFLVYKKGKKTLKFDLMVIVLLQLGAMIYGMYFVSQGRPAWLVQVNDRVMMVSPSMVLDEQNQTMAHRFTVHSWGKPKFVSVQFSDDVQLREKQLNLDVAGQGIVYQPLGYDNYNGNQALQYAKELELLKQYNDENKVNDILSNYNTAIKWLPLRGADFADDLVILLDNQGNVLAIVDLKPW